MPRPRIILRGSNFGQSHSVLFVGGATRRGNPSAPIAIPFFFSIKSLLELQPRPLTPDVLTSSALAIHHSCVVSALQFVAISLRRLCFIYIFKTSSLSRGSATFRVGHSRFLPAIGPETKNYIPQAQTQPQYVFFKQSRGLFRFALPNSRP